MSCSQRMVVVFTLRPATSRWMLRKVCTRPMRGSLMPWSSGMVMALNANDLTALRGLNLGKPTGILCVCLTGF